MRLTDVMSHMDLHVYAEVAMVLFMAAFLCVAWRVLRSRSDDMERSAALPLDDGDAPDRVESCGRAYWSET